MRTAKIMTKYEIEVIEYDPTGYYYPKYKTTQKIISASLEEAIEEALKRTPIKNYGWTKRADVIYSEDILVNS